VGLSRGGVELPALAPPGMGLLEGAGDVVTDLGGVGTFFHLLLLSEAVVQVWGCRRVPVDLWSSRKPKVSASAFGWMPVSGPTGFRS
jgi:hypothetical protein